MSICIFTKFPSDADAASIRASQKLLLTAGEPNSGQFKEKEFIIRIVGSYRIAGSAGEVDLGLVAAMIHTSYHIIGKDTTAAT